MQTKYMLRVRNAFTYCNKAKTEVWYFVENTETLEHSVSPHSGCAFSFAELTQTVQEILQNEPHSELQIAPAQ